jgi:enoyl-[acyl-carrier protein] reductase III
LATAKKMADEGMNICILHRDRRQQMEWIKGAFLAIESLGVKLLHFNVDATREDKQLEVVEVLKKELKNGGKIRLLLHSISKGNLKQLSKSEAQPIDFEKLMYDERIVESYKFVDSIFESPYDENSPTLSRKDFEITLQNMALSLLDWVQLLVKNELFATDARVIGLTSEGSQKSWKGYAAVSAAKATLEALCRSIALEFAPLGIRCNVVQPGVTDTQSLAMIPGSELLKLNAAMRNPFKRLTRPEDVADMIYLLCRDEAKWVNGAVIPVDGGERNS